MTRTMRRWIAGSAAVLSVAFTITLVVLNTATAAGPKGRPTPEPSPPPDVRAHLNPGTTQVPRPIPPESCGAWSAADGSVGAPVARQDGPLRDCGRIGTTWVIDTSGTPGVKSGVIAVYPCAATDQTCLNGQNDHPLAGWHFIKPPYPDGVTLLGVDATKTRLIIDVGGHQIFFDLSTWAFSDN